VSNNVVFDATADQNTYLGSCPSSAATTSSSNDNKVLSEGAKAGIAIAVICIVLIIISLVVYCVYKTNVSPIGFKPLFEYVFIFIK